MALLTLAEAKDLAAALQATVSALGLVIGGIWVWRRYLRHDEGSHHIETDLEIEFLGSMNDQWVAEIRFLLKNVGKVPCTYTDIVFRIDAISEGDVLENDPAFRGLLRFPKTVAEGSFLTPTGAPWLAITRSSITTTFRHALVLPTSARFVMLNAQLMTDKNAGVVNRQRTVKVPDLPALS